MSYNDSTTSTPNGQTEQSNNVSSFTLYYIDAGEQLCTLDTLGELGRVYGYERVANYAVGETRGKAKRAFIRGEDSYCSLEWTDKMSIRKIADGFETEQAAWDYVERLNAFDVDATEAGG